MKQRLRRTSVRVVLVVVSAFGAVLWTVDTVWSMQEPKEVASMSKHMKTVCVGRFLIDVPADAVVTIGSAAVDGFRITNHGAETEEQFAVRLTLREAEINAKKNHGGTKNMERIDSVVGDGVTGKVFIFGLNSTHVYHGEKKIVYLSVEINGYAHVNGMTFSFISNHYDPDNARGLATLMQQLRPVERGHVPGLPGFCMDGAMLVAPLNADQAESVVMFAGLPGHDDLGIGMATIAGKTPGPGLIERHKASRTGEYAFLNLMTSTLLEGPRSIDGMAGDEFAFKARERNLSTGYAFNWETQGTADNVLRPFVSLELQTGNSLRAGGEPVQSTLSEESLADLWRRISASLRLRPVEQPVVADADLQPGLPLGTLAWAGNMCQQTGWWQCGQADANLGVFGGERQFLREGQVVPQALLLPKPTMWQKVRGLQPSYEASTPTNWRLADKRSGGRRMSVAGLAEPLAPGAIDASDPALTAPGKTIRTGELCPAGGWWRCTDEQALDKSRWFAQGMVLPQASYQLPAGGIARRPRTIQLIRRQTSWQLMRLARPEALVEVGEPDAEPTMADAATPA
jgi:hypothetical protein